jgi:hypothetical protein
MTDVVRLPRLPSAAAAHVLFVVRPPALVAGAMRPAATGHSGRERRGLRVRSPEHVLEDADGADLALRVARTTMERAFLESPRLQGVGSVSRARGVWAGAVEAPAWSAAGRRSEERAAAREAVRERAKRLFALKLRVLAVEMLLLADREAPFRRREGVLSAPATGSGSPSHTSVPRGRSIRLAAIEAPRSTVRFRRR